MLATWLWNEGWRWKTRLVMLEQCLTLDAHLIEDHRTELRSWVMIMMNSAENFWPIFLWNRSQDVEGSCFVALCRSIIPAPAPPTKKVHLREMEKRPDGRRQSMGLFFRTPLIFFGKCPFLPGENPIDCNKTITQVDGEKRIFWWTFKWICFAAAASSSAFFCVRRFVY